MRFRKDLLILTVASIFPSVVFAASANDPVWYNKIPPALKETAADIDQDPNLVHKFADNDGTKIHYVTMGSEKKPLMVFVHGFPDFWYTWRNQIKAFSENYRVIALDLRGYNLSDHPEGVENYKFPILLKDIRAVIDTERKGRKVILVGHDWGAALSWLFAGQNPDLVEKLIILSVPHPGAVRKEFLPWNHLVAQAKASAYATRFFAKGKGDTLTSQDLAYWVSDPAVKLRYTKAFSKSSILSMMNYYKANFTISQFVLNFFDEEMKLIYDSVIKCPVLHVQGTEETHYLISSVELEKAWIENPSNLTVKIVPGVGHFIQREIPDELNGIISAWLKD